MEGVPLTLEASSFSLSELDRSVWYPEEYEREVLATRRRISLARDNVDGDSVYETSDPLRYDPESLGRYVGVKVEVGGRVMEVAVGPVMVRNPLAEVNEAVGEK